MNHRLKTCVASIAWSICFAALLQSSWGQEPSTKPFVLKPASPSALEQALPPSSSLPSGSKMLYTGDSLRPIPAPRGAVHGNSPHPMPTNVQQGQTIYLGPDGRVMNPTHMYRSGRVYRVDPSTGALTKSQPQHAQARPKIDYSRAPVQPAVPPKLAPKRPSSIATKTRIVDGTPLVNQQEVVAADTPVSPRTSQTAANQTFSTNTPLLTGVRRMMDGGRMIPNSKSSHAKAKNSNCPNRRSTTSQPRIASRPPSPHRR